MAKYVILGSNSMIGSHLSKLLPKDETYYHTHDRNNLINIDECREVFAEAKVDNDTRIFNMVGYNGGILLNIKSPADIFYQSVQLNHNVLKCCQEFNPYKVISLISACAYPDSANSMSEENILLGHPNETVECHGFAKRHILEYSRQLYKQYGVKSISAILTNAYGDGDRFNLLRTKVVGAAVRKICEAKLNNLPSVTFFGTGKPVRELIYAGDAAKFIIEIVEKYEDYMNPINIGSDQLVSISELVAILVKLIEYTGEIIWDTSKTDGQMIRMLDNHKMYKYVTHKTTPIEDALKNTIDYYMETGRFLDR